MNREDRALVEPVTSALSAFAAFLANPKEITPSFIQGWVTVLRYAGVQPEEIEPAAARLLATQTFFPTPADFIKILRPPEDQDAKGEIAWQLVVRCVDAYGSYGSLTAADLAGDGAALWALSRIGWERLCERLDEDNRAIFRAEFVRTYRVAVLTEARLDYLPGSHERLNDAAGRLLTPDLCGRPDWPELPGRRGTPALPNGTTPLLETVGKELK